MISSKRQVFITDLSHTVSIELVNKPTLKKKQRAKQQYIQIQAYKKPVKLNRQQKEIYK